MGRVSHVQLLMYDTAMAAWVDALLAEWRKMDCNCMSDVEFGSRHRTSVRPVLQSKKAPTGLRAEGYPCVRCVPRTQGVLKG